MVELEQRRLKRAQGKPKCTQDALLAKKKSSAKWEKKMRIKERLQRIRALSQQLKNELDAEQKRAAESRRANRQRKIDNEKKNMVVQTIKNDKIVRKMNPRNRRKARIYMLHELN